MKTQTMLCRKEDERLLRQLLSKVLLLPIRDELPWDTLFIKHLPNRYKLPGCENCVAKLEAQTYP